MVFNAYQIGFLLWDVDKDRVENRRKGLQRVYRLAHCDAVG